MLLSDIRWPVSQGAVSDDSQWIKATVLGLANSIARYMLKNMLRRMLGENATKHVVVGVALYFSYGWVKKFFEHLNADNIGQQSIIVLSSLLIMAFLFANYTFSFKDSDLKRGWQRLVDYIQTGIISFGCGALLEISYGAIKAQLHQPFMMMGVLMSLFYVALVMFDFWDLLRGFNERF
jgi:hypothetical protein